MNPQSRMDQCLVYRIAVRGRLGEDWAGVFEPLHIRHEVYSDGTPMTVLTGPLADQAALHGALQKLYALCLPLLTVEIVPGERESTE